MTKIVTITLNSAIDNIINVSAFRVGSVIRAAESSIYPSGKGINSARALSHFDTEVLALGFIGEESSSLFEQIKSNTTHTSFVKVPERTRYNFTLMNGANELITHIQTPGFNVPQDKLNDLLNTIKKNVEMGDIVILSGSIPPGLPDDIYYDLISLCKSLGAKTIFDSGGNAFKEGIKAGPTWVKPNIEEFEELTGQKVDLPQNLNTVIKELTKLLSFGVEKAYLTLGKDGVLMVGKEIPYALKGKINLEERGKFPDFIGCGDSFVGGLAYSMKNNSTIEQTIKTALSFGTSNLFAKGPGNIDKQKFADFKELLIVEKIIL